MTKAVIRQFIEDVEGRLKALRTVVDQMPEDVSPSPFLDKTTVRLTVAQTYRDMNIQGEPIGAEQVQEMIAAGGVSGRETSWSRDIMEMREE